MNRLDCKACGQIAKGLFLDQIVAQVLSQQVDRPIDDVKHAKHRRKADARDDVDAFGSVRKGGQPAFDEVAASRIDSHLKAAHVVTMSSLIR